MGAIRARSLIFGKMGGSRFAFPLRFWRNTWKFWIVRLGGEPEREELAGLLEGGLHSVFTARPAELAIVNLDPDDVKFIECAVTLTAEWIVTGDRELQNLRKYGRVRIGSPKQFLQAFLRS